MSAIVARDLQDAAAYEREKSRAADTDTTVRRDLARERAARPEILYYLANDRAAVVRREIASNPRTPVQANLLLLKGGLVARVSRIRVVWRHGRCRSGRGVVDRRGWGGLVCRRSRQGAGFEDIYFPVAP